MRPSSPADAPGLFWRRAAFRLKLTVRNVAERLYARRLYSRVSQGAIPHHLAIVLDGNRRYAQYAGLARPADGHRLGAGKVTQVIRWCDQMGIPLVTVWALSTDNLARSRDELDGLFQAISDELDELRPSATSGMKRHVRAIGRLDLLPEALQEKIIAMDRETASAGPWALNIALAYGGRDEVIDAFRRLLIESESKGESPGDIAERFDAATLGRYLYQPGSPDPDLIIRTSGEARLSGFLLWQSAYSELYFCDTLWPAFRWLDFLRAIRSFQGRTRRYGA